MDILSELAVGVFCVFLHKLLDLLISLYCHRRPPRASKSSEEGPRGRGPDSRS